MPFANVLRYEPQVERSYWNEMGRARFAKWLQLGTENHRKQKTQRVKMIFKKCMQNILITFLSLNK